MTACTALGEDVDGIGRVVKKVRNEKYVLVFFVLWSLNHMVRIVGMGRSACVPSIGIELQGADRQGSATELAEADGSGDEGSEHAY